MDYFLNELEGTKSLLEELFRPPSISHIILGLAIEHHLWLEENELIELPFLLPVKLPGLRVDPRLLFFGPITRTLMATSKIVTLDLSGYGFNRSKVQVIGLAMKANENIQTLYLNDSYITDFGAKWIGEALKSNFTLKRLYLDNAYLTDVGVNTLCRALLEAKRSGMEEMSLSGNVLNDEIGGLQQLIATKRTLKMLDVSDNNLSDESKQILRTAGKENNSLTLF